MVREEVHIDRHRQHALQPERREVCEAKGEDAPHAGKVGTDSGIHEAREERHGPNAKITILGIDPAARMRLEQLHDRADDMEHKNDPRLLPRLQTGQ